MENTSLESVDRARVMTREPACAMHTHFRRSTALSLQVSQLFSRNTLANHPVMSKKDINMHEGEHI